MDRLLIMAIGAVSALFIAETLSPKKSQKALANSVPTSDNPDSEVNQATTVDPQTIPASSASVSDGGDSLGVDAADD